MSGRELISKRTRMEFREFLVGYTLGQIEDEFSAADLEPDRSFNPRLHGERRSFVEQYYHRLDFTNPHDVRKLFRVYEAVLIEQSAYIKNPGGADVTEGKRAYDRLISSLRRDGYEFQDGHIRAKSRTAMLRHLAETAGKLDAEYLEAQIDRLMEAVESDTDLAVGQAKELAETCCKTILAAESQTDIDRLELVPLVKRTMKHLQLLPEDISDSAKGLKTIKAILGNLAMISQGMAELRNLYGTGHGKHGRHKRLPVRHARLAVGAATILASFLFETYEERKNIGN